MTEGSSILNRQKSNNSTGNFWQKWRFLSTKCAKTVLVKRMLHIDRGMNYPVTNTKSSKFELEVGLTLRQILKIKFVSESDRVP